MTDETQLDDFGKFIESIKHGVRAEFEAFDESVEDFSPKVILLDAHNAMLYSPVGHFMQDGGEDKNMLGEVVMPNLIRLHEATRAAFLSSTWSAQGSTDGESDGLTWDEIEAYREAHNGSMEGAPWVVETLFGWVADFTGDYVMLQAPMIREAGKPIALGDWVEETLSDGTVIRFDGSTRWNFRDREGYMGRLIEDSLRVLMGGPTQLEIRAAIKVLGNDPYLLERIGSLLWARGINPDELSDEEFGKWAPELLDELREDEEFEEWFRAGIKKMLGEPSPIR